MSMKNIKSLDLVFYQDFKRGAQSVYDNGGIVDGTIDLSKGRVKFEGGNNGAILYNGRLNSGGRDELTMAIWYEGPFTTGGSTYDTWLGQINSVDVPPSEFTLRYRDGLNRLYIFINIDGTVRNIFFEPTASEKVGKHLLVGTWKSGEPMRIYLDGVLKDSSANYSGEIVRPGPNTVLSIGRNTNVIAQSGGTFSKALISFRRYTAQEVKDLYEGSTLRFMSKAKIFLPMASDTVDKDDTTRITEGKKNDIHARLGDGSTPSGIPTFDSDKNRFTFDGGDYMVIPKDHQSIVSKMGSIQDETYVVFYKPFVFNGVDNLYLLRRITSEYIQIRLMATGIIQFECYDGSSLESIVTGTEVAHRYNGRNVMFTFVRGTDYQAIYANETLLVSDTDTQRDGSIDSDMPLFCRTTTGADKPLAGTGIKFFAYWNKALTPTQIKYLYNYLRRT